MDQKIKEINTFFFNFNRFSRFLEIYRRQIRVFYEKANFKLDFELHY